MPTLFLFHVDNTHYAHDARILASYPPADVTIDAIADLLDIDLATLARGAITV